MSENTVSKRELLKDREKAIEVYSKKHRKSNKPALLTKKEKSTLGIGKDQGIATLKHARISSSKVKLVLDLIRNKNIDEAYAILRYTPKAASELLFKLLKSAEANAVNNNDLDREELYVADCYANQGPTLKRIRPRAQGRANRIRKRTSHITLVVKERN